MISAIELFMYRISDLMLAPVLLAILFGFFYGFYCCGQLAMQARIRRKNRNQFSHTPLDRPIGGYELINFNNNNPNSSFDALEVFAFKRLEFLKLVTKIAPMLGLIATMIPMGPALKSLADGNVQGISENLSIAFAAIIFALAGASLCFICASVQKRWLAEELLVVKDSITVLQIVPASPALKEVKEA